MWIVGHLCYAHQKKQMLGLDRLRRFAWVTMIVGYDVNGQPLDGFAEESRAYRHLLRGSRIIARIFRKRKQV